MNYPAILIRHLAGVHTLVASARAIQGALATTVARMDLVLLLHTGETWEGVRLSGGSAVGVAWDVQANPDGVLRWEDPGDDWPWETLPGTAGRRAALSFATPTVTSRLEDRPIHGVDCCWLSLMLYVPRTATELP